MDFIAAHGRLKEKQARKFFREVVAAIDYCHSLRVIHRDIKAENLLLDRHMCVKLIDFGLSNQWTPGGFLKTFCGSPTYTAPELIKRQQYEGPEIDIWALGVLLYVLVCGSLPFDGNSFQELFTKIIRGEYVVPDFVSSECRDLIGRMLVVDPKQRASLDQIREHAWVRIDGEIIPKSNPDTFQTPLSHEDFDESILNEAMSCGFQREDIIEAVLMDSYNHASSTYYLLLSKKLRDLEAQSFQGSNTVEQDVTNKTNESERYYVMDKPMESPHALDVIPENASYSPKTHRRHKTLGSSKDFDSSVDNSEVNKRDHMKKKSSEGSIKRNHILDDRKRREIHAAKANEVSENIDKSPDSLDDGKISNGDTYLIHFDNSKRKKRKSDKKKRDIASRRRSDERSRGLKLESNELVEEKKDDDIRCTKKSSFIGTMKSKIGNLLHIKAKPREARFPLTENSTSYEHPDVIMGHIKDVLQKMEIEYHLTSHYCMKCVVDDLIFEIELCQLQILQLYGVKYQRISGDTWIYASLIKKFLKKLGLKKMGNTKQDGLIDDGNNNNE